MTTPPREEKPCPNIEPCEEHPRVVKQKPYEFVTKEEVEENLELHSQDDSTDEIMHKLLSERDAFREVAIGWSPAMLVVDRAPNADDEASRILARLLSEQKGEPDALA